MRENRKHGSMQEGQEKSCPLLYLSCFGEKVSDRRNRLVAPDLGLGSFWVAFLIWSLICLQVESIIVCNSL